jgi:hypothetical protein
MLSFDFVSPYHCSERRPDNYFRALLFMRSQWDNVFGSLDLNSKYTTHEFNSKSLIAILYYGTEPIGGISFNFLHYSKEALQNLPQLNEFSSNDDYNTPSNGEYIQVTSNLIVDPARKLFTSPYRASEILIGLAIKMLEISGTSGTLSVSRDENGVTEKIMARNGTILNRMIFNGRPSVAIYIPRETSKISQKNDYVRLIEELIFKSNLKQFFNIDKPLRSENDLPRVTDPDANPYRLHNGELS